VNNPYFGADMGLADGVSCQLQAAGNFLIRADTLSTTTPQCFHPDFAHSGGEDLAFFTQLNQKGCSMVWASMAKVHEDVPANRLTHDWLRTRIIGIANSRVRVMQMLKPGLIPSAVRGLKTVALFAQAGLFSLVGIVIPSQREAAEQLRWKFIGKFTAHMQKKTVRPEGH